MKAWILLIKDLLRTLRREKKLVLIPLMLLIIFLGLTVVLSLSLGPLTPFVYSLL